MIVNLGYDADLVLFACRHSPADLSSLVSTPVSHAASTSRSAVSPDLFAPWAANPRSSLMLMLHPSCPSDDTLLCSLASAS